MYGVIYTMPLRSDSLFSGARVAEMAEYGFPLLFPTISLAAAWCRRFHPSYHARPSSHYDATEYIAKMVEVHSGRLRVEDGKYVLKDETKASYQKLVEFLTEVRNASVASRNRLGIPQNALR